MSDLAFTILVSLITGAFIGGVSVYIAMKLVTKYDQND